MRTSGAPLATAAETGRGAEGQAAAGDPRYRFLARFGATILSGGIAAMPMALYHYQAELGLAPQEVWFVGYILAHRWTAALPYPSLRQMSRRTGISTQMLHRYKQSLIEKGYLETIPRHRPSGGRTSNFYDFSGLFQALERCLTRDRRDAAWQPTADEAEHDGADLDEPAAATGSAARLATADHTGPAKSPDPEPLVAPGPMPLPPPTAAKPRLKAAGPVTASQHQSAVDAVPAYGHTLAGSQLRLIGGGQPERPGPRSSQLPGDRTQTLPAPDDRSDPQESRSPGGRFNRTATADEKPRAPEAERPNETSKRPVHNVPLGNANAAEERWHRAISDLSSSVSEAALRSWILPLRPVLGPPGPRCAVPPGTPPTRDDATGKTAGDEADGARVLLTCPTAFHRDQVLRRYLPALEAALGTRVELVVASHAGAPHR